MEINDYLAEQIRLNHDSVMNGTVNPQASRFLYELVRSGSRTLDLGCGTGDMTNWLRGKRGLAIGIDCGKVFIDEARIRHGSDDLFRVMDMHRLEFDNKTFDCVVADNVLEHSNDVPVVLGEILRVLMPGGLLLSWIPLDGVYPEDAPPAHLWKPTNLEEITSAMEETGFVEVQGASIDVLTVFGIPHSSADNLWALHRARRGER